MRVAHHASADDFLARTRAFLEANEPEHGLMLGIAASHAADGAEQAIWAAVEDGGTPVATAIRTPPFNLVVSRATEGALRVLAEDLAARGVSLPGVTAPAETARAFAELWTRARNVRAEVTMRQGVYELTEVIAPSKRAPGSLREARADEAVMLASWMRGFGADAGLPSHEQDAFAERAAALIASRVLFVWDDGGAPVSMAGLQGETRHGVRVALVYTPRDLRGRGYASACVAALSAHALARGRSFCMLYTDLANPTSNAIYQRIGYRQIAESSMIAFHAHTA